MKMLRFLRRVFIILVLLFIIFFVFRLIKPEATSRFVDKVRSMPANISSRFHREKKSEIIINGNTTYSSGNFAVDDGEIIGEGYEIEGELTNEDELANEEEFVEEDKKLVNENTGDINDLSRFDELNKEIDAILTSGNDSGSGERLETNVNVDGNSTKIENVEQNSNIVENTAGNLEEIIGEMMGDESLKIGPVDIQTSGKTANNTPKNTSIILTNQQRGDCAEAGLTVKDCEDLIRDFGNFN